MIIIINAIFKRRRILNGELVKINNFIIFSLIPDLLTKQKVQPTVTMNCIESNNHLLQLLRSKLDDPRAINNPKSEISTKFKYAQYSMDSYNRPYY